MEAAMQTGCVCRHRSTQGTSERSRVPVAERRQIQPCRPLQIYYTYYKLKYLLFYLQTGDISGPYTGRS